MTQTNYDEIIPSGVIFNLAQIQDMNLIKVSTAKKLIANGKLECVKIGNKLHLSRSELINYLQSQTVPKISEVA